MNDEQNTNREGLKLEKKESKRERQIQRERIEQGEKDEENS